MGRGDKKTKKGKRFSSSYGRLRPRKVKTKKYELEAKKREKVEVVEELEGKETNKKSNTKKKTKKSDKKKI